MTWPPPTDEVRRLVELIGAAATLRLLEARGGTRLYLADPDEDRAVARIIGLDGHSKLAAHYGRDRIKVPIARHWRILCYRAQGLSYRETALKAGCTEGRVWQVLAQEGATAHQFDLFKAS